MNNSALFTEAHKIAKKTVAVVGNYMIAFSLALKTLYKEMDNMLSKENKLIAAGGKLWEKNGMKRIYMTNAALKQYFGETVINFNDRKHKVFYDLNTATFGSSSKTFASALKGL